MLRWGAGRPSEVELVDGDWWFITALLADAEEDEHVNLSHGRASRDTPTPAAARDTSRRSSR